MVRLWYNSLMYMGLKNLSVRLGEVGDEGFVGIQFEIMNWLFFRFNYMFKINLLIIRELIKNFE